MRGNSDLIQFISREITLHGPVSFRWFMQQALYHPEFGYYASGKARIGREGDFFTNVSVGPLFGRLLAAQFVEMWEQLDRPEQFTIVEQGANNGDFAADVLAELEHTELFSYLTYRVVEPVGVLRQQQARRLDGKKCVQWAESLEALEPFCGVHFSNELIDAMPVELVCFLNGKWHQRCVGVRNGKFEFVDVPGEFPELPEERAEGYQTEVNREALDWIDQVSAKITRGFILAIDYGYPKEEFYSPDRGAGTLTCYSGHQKSSNPLENVGETDITAHVEFGSLIERAFTRGMTLCGFTDQHRYLVKLAAPLLEALGRDPKALRAFRTLMHPAFMGSAFKVLGLQKGVESKLRGF